MPAFWKRPKFWVAAIIIAWLLYVIWANFQLNPVEIHLIPWFVKLELKVSAIIIGSAIVGCILTLVIQFLWRKGRSSKNAAESAAASAVSNKTVA